MSIGQGSPSVHILFDDLGGEYAIEVEGSDGETYCVLDNMVLENDPAARASALVVVRRAYASARRRIACAG